MSDNGDLIIGVGAQTDGASFAQAKAAVAGLGEAYEKTFAQVDRSKSLESTANAFAKIAVSENDAAKSAIGLVEQLKKVGATDKEIERTVSAFEKQIGAIKKADAASAQAAQAQEARAARAAANAKKRADEALERDEIAARAENDKRNAEAEGTGFGRVANVFGREVKSLPSVQLGNTGVGTDAVAKIVGLSGALVDAASKSDLVTAASKALTPVLGAQQAATVAAYAPAAAFVAAFAAIGLALKSLTDETSKNVATINAFAESQRKVSDKAAGGSTSKDIEKENQRLEERRKREVETLQKLQKAYDDADKALLGNTSDVLRRDVARAFSGDEQELVNQIAASQKVITDTTAEYNANTKALEDGTFAANDAASAEEELAKSRSKTALASADSAGRDLAAQQKALANTEEGNKKRLEAIKDEQAVAQVQIDTLRQSGVTSAEVTEKIAALEAQLSGLGKEAKFIEGTALEVSRRADAAKKARKDIEDNEKKIEAAQESIVKLNAAYAQKQEDIARQSAQKVADINQANRDKLKDIDSKFFTDLVKLTNDARSDEAKALRQRNEDEANAIIDANRKFEQIRNDAIQSEQDAINSRNFLQAAKIREQLERSNKDALEEYQQGVEDRQRNAEFERQERAIAFEEARQERYAQYQKELADQRENVNRQLRDARIAKERQLQEAAIAYQRELQTQQAFIKQYSAANIALYKSLLSVVGSATKAAGGARSSAPSTSSTAGASFAGSGTNLRPVPAATNNTTRNSIGSLTITTSANPEDVIRVLERVGLVG